MNRVLVTGAMGFIGGKLTQSLIADGRHVTLLVRDGRQQEAKQRFPQAEEIVVLQDLIEDPDGRYFETIFHLATLYIYQNTIADIPQLIAGNITLPTTLADISSRWKAPVAFVNVSTFMQHFQGATYAPTCLYAATKKSIEDILYYYENSARDFLVTNIVFPHIYGEGDTRVKLLNLLINASKSNSNVHLASGRQLLDLVHVNDAVEALKSVEEMAPGRWSIGNDSVFSIKELIQMISEITGSQLNVTFDESKDREFDTFEIWETANRLPGWTRRIDLKEWISEQLAP